MIFHCLDFATKTGLSRQLRVVIRYGNWNGVIFDFTEGKPRFGLSTMRGRTRGTSENTGFYS